MEGWNQEGSTSRKVTVVIEIADDIAVKRRTKLNVSQKQMAEKMDLKQATPIWHARTQPQLRARTVRTRSPRLPRDVRILERSSQP